MTTTKPRSTTETLESREESICRFCDQAIHLAGDEWKHNFNDSIWCRRTTATPRLSPASAAPVVDTLLTVVRKAAAESCREYEWGCANYGAEESRWCVPCFARKLATAATAAPQQSDTRPSCWHCGVVLAYAPKLRCEDCPEECDVEGCDELGCSTTGATVEQTHD